MATVALPSTARQYVLIQHTAAYCLHAYEQNTASTPPVYCTQHPVLPSPARAAERVEHAGQRRDPLAVELAPVHPRELPGGRSWCLCHLL